MHHVGNDIVDIGAPGAKNKSSNQRFTAKILTLDEARAVRCDRRPDAVLWALWAAKETAYKTISKSFPGASSAPLKYRVMMEQGNSTGMVETPYGNVAVKFFFHETHINCIGIDGTIKDLDLVLWGYGPANCPENAPLSPSMRESAAARALAIGHIARHCGINAHAMEIKNDLHAHGTGPPVLYVNGKRGMIDISLSHDERFAAYAFCIRSDNPHAHRPPPGHTGHGTPGRDKKTG